MAKFDPFEHLPGGWSSTDGTIEYYLRIRSLVHEESCVLDLGAGRGAWFEDDDCRVRHWIRHIQPDVKRLVAIDVDSAVLENRSTDTQVIQTDEALPFEDESFDLVTADYVLEHIQDVSSFASEVRRVLKPGGHFCARTPHAGNYVALIARLVRNEMHTRVLASAQPMRKGQDVFPTVFAANTKRAVMGMFPGWHDSSYIFRTDPAYYFGNEVVYSLMSFVHKIVPPWLVGNLFVFVTKPIERRLEYLCGSSQGPELVERT